MQVRRLISILLLLTAAGCEENNTSGDFLSAPREDWVANARPLDTDSVMKLYIESVERPAPADTRLAEALGPRGKGAILSWIMSVEKEGALIRVWEFSPILFEVRKSTGYSICGDAPVYRRAVSAIHQAWGFRDRGAAERMIRTAC